MSNRPNVNDNGIVREMTVEEYADYLRESEEYAQYEAEREPTEAERLRADLDFVMAMEGLL